MTLVAVGAGRPEVGTARASAAITWQVPTRIRSGPGVLEELGLETAALGPCAAVVLDEAITEHVPVRSGLDELRRHGVATPLTCVVSGVPDLDGVRSLVRRLAALRVTVIVAMGGGSTMDLAKLAALGATNPSLLDDATWAPTAVLDRYQDRDLVPGLPTLLVPTTAATGSEVNPVAAVEHLGQRRLLLSGQLVASTALVDPRFLRSLTDAQLLEGLVETFSRIAGPYLGDARSETDVTDRISESLAAAALTLGDRIAGGRRDETVERDVQWLVTLSGTHVATVGRPDWSHTLWYLQDSVGAVTGLPKGPSTAALLPAFLGAVASGEGLGPSLGHQARLQSLIEAVRPSLGASARDVSTAARRMLDRWGLPSGLRDVGVTALDGGVEAVARLAHRRWSRAGPLSGASRADFESFFAAAAAPPPSAGS